MKHFTRTVLAVSLVLWLVGCGQATSPEAPAPEPVQAETVPSTAVAVDKGMIAGTWQRTDAPYQLVISGIAEDGTMTAAYLNPNPIKVSKASWVDGKGVISVFVELRDVNYPGSNYTLTYAPDRDMLVGRYFQAVQGVTYDVSFSREK